MTEERVTPLRQRMIEDMNIRGLAEKTQKAPIRSEDPRVALHPTPRTSRRVRARGQDHPAHPARAMPLLWRPHAHHRDLPARAETDVACTPREQAAR